MNTYRSTPTSTLLEPGQRRRTPEQMDMLRHLIHQTVDEYKPMTVRQVFYQMVSKGAIGKTEGEYKSTVGRLLVEMRKSGQLPYSWIADNTRWMRKPTTFDSVHQMLKNAARGYRLDLWRQQPHYVEVWLEKEALAGVLVDVTGEWDVPLMVTRGYSSLTFLHSAAEAIAAQSKPAYLYYFGDHDPSGVDITRNVEQTIREGAPGAEIHFEKIAVTRQQIDDMDLPTRPTKKTDSRSRNFEGESVEVDAISPPVLRDLCRAAIEKHVDQDIYRNMRAIEEEERRQLKAWIKYLPGNMRDGYDDE